MKYIIEVPDDMEYALLTGGVRGGYYSQEIEFAKLEKAEPHWIPVEHALPEDADEVITTYIVNGNRDKHYVETATYYRGDGGYWSSPWDEYRIAGTRKEVIAWMPLPAPFYEEVTT